MGSPAHNASAAIAGKAACNFPAFARREILTSTTVPDTASKGRLLILVRYVAASARPLWFPIARPACPRAEILPGK